MDGFRVRLADLQSRYTCSSKLVKYGSDLRMVGRGAHMLEVLDFFDVSLQFESLGLFTVSFKQTQTAYEEHKTSAH